MKSTYLIVPCAMIICSVPQLTLPDEVSEKVKAMYDKADALYESGEYEQASSAYREILKIKPLWRMYLNIGQCEMMRERYDLAMEAFQIYLKEGKEKVTDERREYTNKRISEMTSKTASLTFTETESLDIIVDDMRRAATPMTDFLYVLPGEHQIALKRGDKSIFEKTIVIAAGEEVSIERPKPEPTAESVATKEMPIPLDTDDTSERSKQIQSPVQTAAPTVKRRSPLKPVGFALLAVGGAIIIPGTITGIMYISQNNYLEERCPTGKNCSDDVLNTRKTVDALAVTTNVMLPIGGVLAATGIVFTVVGHRKSKRKNELGFTPLIDNTVTGLTISGRF